MKFNYYSLESHEELISGHGELEDFNIAAEQYFKSNQNKFSEHRHELLSKDIEGVDPLMDRQPEEWQKAMSTAILIITGNIPSQRDKKYFKKIYSDLKQHSKQNPQFEILINSREFIFGCLPYLMAGFNIENKGWSRDGANNIGNFTSFINAINNGASASSFFCAHREKEPIMVNQLDFIAIRRACNLILGALKNVNPKSKTTSPNLTIFQPNASIDGIGAVFPEMFLTYFNDEKLGELIAILDRHFHELTAFFQKEYSGDVKLIDLSEHKSLINTYASNYYGPNWRSLNLLPRDKADKVGINDLNDIVETTAEKIRRFMPYYAQGLEMSSTKLEKNINSASELGTILDFKELIQGATDDFGSVRTAVGKAIYETIFCSVWGQDALHQNKAIVGLEREHNLFQTMGIAFGYHEGKLEHRTQNSVPALFAKRSTDHAPDVSSLSFRQFWRVSEKISK